ncbi:hypothetical protein DYB34_005892 [Aphanomyces astaci]|uniref:Calcineurin-like phosphoesterase domain-containing protein n=2 Tax=Aphanomyces astaci TaxID=112090 RepID=A0A418BVD4_APHAT|nr:hypothetical protein DYB34_005892 [Aphanomyces astaci]
MGNTWFLVFATVFLSFYIFTSPFVENRELLDRWTPYVYFSMGLYTWLLSAVVVHVPLTKLGMMDYDVKQPVLRRRDLDDANFPKTYNRHACDHVFGVASSRIPVPARLSCSLRFLLLIYPRSYQGALYIWLTGMTLAMINFVFERMVGFQMFSMQWHRVDDDDDDEDNKHATLPPDHALPMVPWYSMFMFDTGFQDELWFDFMADCGDGFNSSFQIARMLAQPHLKVNVPLSNSKFPREAGGALTLPRGDCLVLGGDLAYPHPDADSYEVGTIPTTSNHDWFDGLNTYSRFVCERDWLGGWHLPQDTSFFALKLPHGWWVLGCDLALEHDINVEQFACFEAIVERHMGPSDRVIVVTHEPSWILDEYEGNKSEEKLQYLITSILKGRVVVRLAGDIHNYTRHSLVESDHLSVPAKKQHPSPAPSKLSVQTTSENVPSLSPFSPVTKHFPHMNSHDTINPIQLSPDRSNCFAASGVPSTSPSSKAEAAPVHLIVSGGGGAFLHPTHVPSGDNLVSSHRLYTRASCYPSEKVCRCNAEWMDVVVNFLADLWTVHYQMLTTSYLSLATFLGLVVGHWLFADSTSSAKRLVISVAASLCHSMAAFSVLIAFESMFQAASDRSATPLSGIIVGVYLYLAVNVFKSHYNEAFSALRVASYKNILRLHIKPNGDLEMFALGVDKMPTKWIRSVPSIFPPSSLHARRSDPAWSGTGHKLAPSYEWKVPSYWKPKMSRVDNILRFDMEEETFDRKLNSEDRSHVKLVDYVLYPKN